MRARRVVMVLACALAAIAISGSARAQNRGDARIGGKVVDDQGKPVQDVIVRATMVGQPQPLQAKTNNRGDWTINGIAGGQWELEFGKEGFAPHRITLEVGADQRIPNIQVALARPKPAVDPNVEIQAEVQRAAGLLQNKQIGEARKIYEDLLVKYPTLHQLHQFIARTYAAENQLDKAIEHMKLSLEKDPDNPDLKTLLGDLLMEKGDKVEGQKILESVDITKAKDPYPFINLAITKINDQKTDEALPLLDKLLVQFPQEKSLLYYRGRAYLAAKKLPEAKADLEKFVAAAAPDARELPDAKKILEQLKDVK